MNSLSNYDCRINSQLDILTENHPKCNISLSNNDNNNNNNSFY